MKKSQKRINALVDVIARQQTDYEQLEEYALYAGSVIQALTEGQDIFEEEWLRDAVASKAEADNLGEKAELSVFNTQVGELIDRCGEEASANGEHEYYSELVGERRSGNLEAEIALADYLLAQTEKINEAASEAKSILRSHNGVGGIYFSDDGEVGGYSTELAKAVIKIYNMHVLHSSTHNNRSNEINGNWFCCGAVQLGVIAMDDCEECGQQWPCPTVKVLTGDIG